MREARGEPALAEEARAQLGVAGEVLREALERDRPVELLVDRQIDDRHRAVPERPLDAIPPCQERSGQPSPPSS